MWFGSIFFGIYGVIPALLIFLAVIGYSVDYLQQIVKKSGNGENKPPMWEVYNINYSAWLKSILPVVFSLLEAIVATSIFIWIFSIFSQLTFVELFVKLWKICLLIPFIIFFPVNLLSHSLINDLNILNILTDLSNKSIIYIFTLFPIMMILIIMIIFIPINFIYFHFFIKWFLAFYFLQVFSFALGRMYYNNNIDNM